MTGVGHSFSQLAQANNAVAKFEESFWHDGGQGIRMQNENQKIRIINHKDKNTDTDTDN